MRSHALAVLASLVLCVPAHATLMTFGYEGHVTQVPALDPIDPFGGAVHEALVDPGTGDVTPATTFSGFFSIDSNTPDADPSSQSGSYEDDLPPAAFTVDIAGFHFAYTGVGVAVGDLFPGLGDFLGVQTVPFDSGNFITIFLASLGPDVLAGDALPAILPDLASSFPQRDWHFAWTFPADDPNLGQILVQVQVDGQLDRLFRVPEPSTLLLTLAALTLLVRRVPIRPFTSAR
jgi:hypothetical protein